MQTRTAFITGASRGIGHATARRLLATGCDVIAHYRTETPALAALSEEAAAQGRQVTWLQADFTDPDAAGRLLESLDAARADAPIDVAVLNAGIAPFGTATEFSPAQLRELLQVNTVAPYELAAGLTERLRAPGAALVFTGSALTRYAFPTLTGYGMSKIAVEFLARNLAAELGPRGITVNVIAPGVVDTDINAGWLPGSPEAQAATRDASAMGVIPGPDDIAETVAFLAAATSQTITGQVIDVSAGTQL